jgi:hypothetical protein
MVFDEEKYEHVVLGKCFGFGLRRRHDNDPHVCWILLVEDDENWFPSQHGGSSFWLKDVQQVLKKTIEWLNNNCIKTNEGWSFKK